MRSFPFAEAKPETCSCQVLYQFDYCLHDPVAQHAGRHESCALFVDLVVPCGLTFHNPKTLKLEVGTLRELTLGTISTPKALSHPEPLKVHASSEEEDKSKQFWLLRRALAGTKNAWGQSLLRIPQQPARGGTAQVRIEPGVIIRRPDTSAKHVKSRQCYRRDIVLLHWVCKDTCSRSRCRQIWGSRLAWGLQSCWGVPFEWGTLEGQAQQEPAWSEEIWSLSLRVAFARI